jgi:hypothetical protein
MSTRNFNKNTVSTARRDVSKVEDPFACFGSSSSSNSEDDKEGSDDEDEEHEDEEKPTNMNYLMSDVVGNEGRDTVNMMEQQTIRVENTRQHHVMEQDEQPLVNTSNDFHCANNTTPRIGVGLGSLLVEVEEGGPTSSTISTIQPLYVSPRIAIQSTTDTTTPTSSSSSNSKGTGGRGYFATDRIPPGTLLLVEKPLVTWSDDQIGKPLGLVSVLHALQQPNANEIIQAFEVLHPTKVYLDELLLHQQSNNSNTARPTKTDTIGQRIVQLYHSYYEQYAKSNVLRRILQLGAQLQKVQKRGQMHTFSVTDAIRMLLVFRLNAFQTGAYLYMSMFNHSCQPNCTKFTPSDTFPNDRTTSVLPSRNNNHQTTSSPTLSCYSQIWTNQWITKGQELTLFYLHPRELSHATRRFRFWEQHLLDIDTEDTTSGPASVHNNLMEMVHGSMPSSILPLISTMIAQEEKQRRDSTKMTTLTGETTNSNLCPSNPMVDVYDTEQNTTIGTCIVTSTIEDILADWEVQYVQIDNEITSIPSPTNNNDLYSFHSTLKELESSTLDFCHKTSTQLDNPYHILMIRCYRLHTDCAILYMNHVLRPLLLISEEINTTPTNELPNYSRKETEKEVSTVGCRCILNLYNLLDLQVRLLGEHHYDIGRTYYDLWNEIGHVLSTRSSITKLNQKITETATYSTSTSNAEQGITEIVNPKFIRTFAQWSKEEDRCRREYERIRKLYPNDIEPIIHQN